MDKTIYYFWKLNRDISQTSSCQFLCIYLEDNVEKNSVILSGLTIPTCISNVSV